MGIILSRMKKGVCRFLFWAKVFLAVAVASAGTLLQLRMVIVKYQLAVNLKLPKINAPLHCPAVKNRLDPMKFIFGFSIDWSKDTPTSLGDRLGKRPLIFNVFVKISKTEIPKDAIYYHCKQTASAGAILELTVDPSDKLEQIPIKIYHDLAVSMRQCNVELGVPVLLRFGHEMNGGWMEYGNSPIEYIDVSF
jgi:hypothetical protein